MVQAVWVMLLSQLVKRRKRLQMSQQQLYLMRLMLLLKQRLKQLTQ